MAMFSSWLIVIGCSVSGEKPRVSPASSGTDASDVSAPAGARGATAAGVEADRY